MWQCEGWLLGRRPLSGGPVDAASLARLVRSLGPAAPRPQRRPPTLLRCRDDRLELAARHDDEGFESDDDSRSLASDDTAVSNSSSCCFVDDHVYRRGAAGAGVGKPGGVPPPPRPVPPPGVAGPLASTSSTTSDSANSSGASDTDEADHQPAAAGSVAALVQSLSLYQRVVKTPGAVPAASAAAAHEPEIIPVADVAFCHTDPALPRVAVWVVRRRRSAWAAATSDDAASQAPAGLEAIVFETNNERALRKLCNHFQDVSRRLKLDQYRHPHRRKEGAAAPGRPPAYSSLAQPSPSPSSSYSSSPSPSPVGKQAAVSLSSGISSSSSVSTSSGGSAKSQQRVEPARVSPHQQQQVFKRLEAPAVVARFNLLQRTDGDGVTHLEVARDTPLQESQPAPGRGGPSTASGPSSIISLSTPEAPAPPPAAPATTGKQRPILVLGPRSDQLEAAELRKVWSPRPPPSPPPPPQRPERRRFARKSHKAPAPPPPPSPPAQQQHPPSGGSKGDRNKVLRGQLVSPSSAWPQYTVVRGSAWCAQPQAHTQPRSRSKSPPRPRRAAAASAASSRYAEAARFLGGLSQRLRDAVGGGGGGGGGGHPQHHLQQQQCSLYGTAARRRSTPDVFRSAENLLAGAGGHRLKSVIKKARRPDCRAEPKKVTFSAYATVQVVD
ncbi:atrophin-1-like [Schistocerca serialis cubense]|uniref:atrophin-1-like n=1 Tax=Schistocerca serialis cubense TaxID=2023355 RepID=UPI00214E0B4C|nr:atrophin-1-like [Schistocerca serialis cubense]XP_049942070.1 atrophin-1-like [Schistocerca serialis cubense]